MTERLKEIINELSKDQLIYLIEQYYHSQFLINETCVDESKCYISSENAVQKIRSYLYNMPKTYNVADFKALIDWKMGKITVDECRKMILGLDQVVNKLTIERAIQVINAMMTDLMGGLCVGNKVAILHYDALEIALDALQEKLKREEGS